MIGVAPAYRTRVRDDIAVCPTQRMFTNAYHILRLPALTSKTRETAFQISTAQFGQTTKRTNLECGQIQTVKDMGQRKHWNISSVNVRTTRNRYGVN
jgi:hypothetical protein